MAIRENTICGDTNWINIEAPNAQEMQQVSERYGLNEYTVRDCLQPEHLPKYEFVDGIHFLIYYSFSPLFAEDLHKS